MEKLYKGILGPDGNNIFVEFSAEDYAQWEIDRVYHETTVLPKEIREERNKLLAETDWTQALDVPQATREAWAAYRQALRDVPQQPGFPTNVTWPIRPDQPTTSGTQDL